MARDSFPFAAQYAGTCDACEEKIRPGQQVRYTATDDLVHAGCVDGAPRMVERKEVTCETCWLIKPCECEESK